MGLVLTTQAAAENSSFTSSAAAVLSATAVGAIAGFVFYLWGQRQELQAIEGRRRAAAVNIDEKQKSKSFTGDTDDFPSGGTDDFPQQPHHFIRRPRKIVGVASATGGSAPRQRHRIQPDHENYHIYTQFAEANPPSKWAMLMCSGNTGGELIAHAEFFYDEEKNTWQRFDPNWLNEDLPGQLTGNYEWTSEDLPPEEI